MSEHPEIWLEPEPPSDREWGRQWCQHNVWGERAAHYVLASAPAPTVSRCPKCDGTGRMQTELRGFEHCIRCDGSGTLAALRKARTVLDGLYEGFLHNTEAGCEAWDDADGFELCSEIDALLAAAPAPTVSGEAVAWRVRPMPGFAWVYVEGDPDRNPALRDYEKQPVYVHPSPTRAEVLEEAARTFEEIRLILINRLDEPERSAFWKAVAGRDTIRRALAGEKP